MTRTHALNRSRAGRVAASLIPAAGLTLCLFVVMDALIKPGDIEFSNEPFRGLTVVTPREVELNVRSTREPVVRLPEVAPPPRPEPFRAPDLDDGPGFEVVRLHSPEPDVGADIVEGVSGPVRVTREPVPVRTPRPVYPPRALAQGLEGDCEVRFSIDAAGRPQNAEAVCTDEIFARASVRAVEQVLFAARVIDGVPVGQDNLTYPIQYRLDD